MNELGRALPLVGFFFMVSIAGCRGGCGGDSSAQTSSIAVDASSTGPLTSAGPPQDAKDANRDAGLPPAIPNAKASVDKIRPGLRMCFAEQLQRKPVPLGTVTFTIEIGGDGKVTSATPKTREGLDDACIACMTERVKEGTFERPLDGMPATVIAPFTFHSAAGRGAASGGGPALPSDILPPDPPDATKK